MKSLFDKLKLKIESGTNSIQFARRAENHRLSGEVQKAIELCQKGLKVYPAYATGYYILAQCYTDQGLNLEAKEALTEALRFDPHHLAVLSELAGLYHADGNLSQSLYYYNQALAIDPLNTRIQAIVSELSDDEPEELIDSTDSVSPQEQPEEAPVVITPEVSSVVVEVEEEPPEITLEEEVLSPEDEVVAIPHSEDEVISIPENEVFEEEVTFDNTSVPVVEEYAAVEEDIPEINIEPPQDFVQPAGKPEASPVLVADNIPVLMSGPWLAEMLQDYLPLSAVDRSEPDHDAWPNAIFESVMALGNVAVSNVDVLEEEAPVSVDSAGYVIGQDGVQTEEIDLPAFEPIFREEDEPEVIEPFEELVSPEQDMQEETDLAESESQSFTNVSESEAEIEILDGTLAESDEESSVVGDDLTFVEEKQTDIHQAEAADEVIEFSTETPTSDDSVEDDVLEIGEDIPVFEAPETDETDTTNIESEDSNVSDVFNAGTIDITPSENSGDDKTVSLHDGSSDDMSPEVDHAGDDPIQSEVDHQVPSVTEKNTTASVDFYLDQFFTGEPPVEDVSDLKIEKTPVDLKGDIKGVTSQDISTVKQADSTIVKSETHDEEVAEDTPVDTSLPSLNQKSISDNQTERDDEKMMSSSFDAGQGGNFGNISGLEVIQEVQTQEAIERKRVQKQSSDEDVEPEAIPTATLAELYVRQGLWDRAISVYLMLIEHDPTNPDIHKRLSELLVLKDQKERR